MLYFDINYVIEIHDDIIEESGGLSGYNSTQIGYLCSALEQIQNDDYYSTFYDKISHLIFSCIKFHPFLDGNKRTSIYLGRNFAKLNNVDLGEEYFREMEEIVVQVAEGTISKETLKSILEKMNATQKRHDKKLASVIDIEKFQINTKTVDILD